MLLALDTTTEILHLALIQGERVWTRRVLSGVGRGHSEWLLPTLNELMAEAGAVPKALSGVAACLGPGGFTSLRIGVATAEGFGLAGLPTWGFSAFALRAEALSQAGVRGTLLDPAGWTAERGLPSALGGRPHRSRGEASSDLLAGAHGR